MIKVICNTDGDSIYFDCEGHAEHEADRCVETSTLCSALVRYMGEKHSRTPEVIHDGKITFSIGKADEGTKAVFEAAMLVFSSLAEKHPKDIKVY